MKKLNSPLLNNLLKDIDPVDQAKTDAKMELAAKIAQAMIAKNWKKKDLLEAIGKDNPSIITKWLSGTHNFTVETLIDLEKALDIRLIDREFKQVPIMEYRINVSSSMDNSGPFSYINDILNSTTLGPSKKALVFQIN